MVWQLFGRSLAEIGRGVGLHPIIYEASAAIILAGGITLAILRSQLNATRRACLRERRAREEMEVYIRLDTRVGKAVNLPQMADKVCRTVSVHSPFRRVAMLLRDVDGALYIAASSGMDPSTVAALQQWGTTGSERRKGVRLGVRSMVTRFANEERGVVIPLQNGRRPVGELVVMAESILDVQRRAAEEAIVTLEALGMKLGRSIESVTIAEREMRAEKLPSRGVFAGEPRYPKQSVP